MVRLMAGCSDCDGSVGLVVVLRLRANGTVANSTIIGNGQGGLPTGLLPGSSLFGDPVSTIGDLDHDGYHDVVVRAHSLSHGGPGYGAIFVLFMFGDDTVKTSTRLSQAVGEGFDTATISGASLHSLFGVGVAALPLQGYDQPNGLLVHLHLDGINGLALVQISSSGLVPN